MPFVKKKLILWLRNVSDGQYKSPVSPWDDGIGAAVCRLRISAPYLNNSIKTALTYRNAILNDSISGKGEFVKEKEESPYGEDTKMVRKITQKQRYFTDAEKDHVVKKYQSGMSMAAIARVYGCYYTTVRKVLIK